VNESPVELEERLAAIAAFAELFFGVSELEPLLVDLLEFIQAGTVGRELLEKRLVTLFVAASPGSVEVLEFVMRTLRWPVVELELRMIRDSDSDFRVVNEAKRVLEVFETDWDNGDIYRFYSQSPGQQSN
jgi:hypothetical protein